MTNKKLGNDFESQFCEILFNEGFWVHNMAQNASGQPADVIAARNGKTHLIDCKVCSTKGYFPLSRVEENQELSMELWEKCGNGTGYFAILLPGNRIYMVSHWWVRHFKEKQSSIREEEICNVGCPLTQWIESVL